MKEIIFYFHEMDTMISCSQEINWGPERSCNLIVTYPVAHKTLWSCGLGPCFYLAQEHTIDIGIKDLELVFI